MSSDQIEAFNGFYYELRSIVEKKPEAGSNEVETKTLRNLIDGLEMGDNQVVANVLGQLDESCRTSSEAHTLSKQKPYCC